MNNNIINSVNSNINYPLKLGKVEPLYGITKTFASSPWVFIAVEKAPTLLSK